jgi:hypothetical protein
MNNKALFYCSDLSKNASEPVFGTASRGNTWLLLEHPEPWGQKALVDNRMPDQVKERLSSTLERINGGRFLLVRQRYSQTDCINFFIVATREDSPQVRHFRLKEYKELLDLDIWGLVQTSNQPAGDGYQASPLYLVCTDGAHDKCCAKYGIRTYEFIREKFGESVWASSHVGGDRFAANMVCFPHGLFFGHVTEAAAEGVAREYRDGRIYLANYRGRGCYSRNAQVGEYFIRLHCGDVRIDSLRFVGEEVIDRSSSRVSFQSIEDGTIHAAWFSRRESEIENQMSCRSEEKRPFLQYSLLEYVSRSARGMSVAMIRK